MKIFPKISKGGGIENEKWQEKEQGRGGPALEGLQEERFC